MTIYLVMNFERINKNTKKQKNVLFNYNFSN